MTGNNSLRDRVRSERQRQETGDVATVDDKPKTIEAFLDRMQGEMARILPQHISAERMARIVLTEVRRVPLLVQCTQPSFYGALMTCAQLGLEPGVSGEAYLIPFKNTRKNCYEVQLIIGYQGMAKLFWQSPLARSLDAQVVFENDDFDYAYGLEPKLVHKPLLSGDRGQVIAYYAVARMANGGSAFVVMSPDDIEKIRDRSRAKDDGPWKTDRDWMSKKTCIRQIFKLLPRSPELSQALAQDGAVRTDLSEAGIDLEPEYPDAVPGEVVNDAPSGQVVGEPAQQQQKQPERGQGQRRAQAEPGAPDPDDPGPADRSGSAADGGLEFPTS